MHAVLSRGQEFDKQTPSCSNVVANKKFQLLDRILMEHFDEINNTRLSKSRAEWIGRHARTLIVLCDTTLSE
jgi:hypothetical protein